MLKKTFLGVVLALPFAAAGLYFYGLAPAKVAAADTTTVATNKDGSLEGLRAAASDLVVSAAANASDVTIYGAFAQVQETRKVVNVPAGHAKIQLTGIAAKYRADSLRLIKVDGPGAFTYRSATYQPANLTPERLLAEAIGKRITGYRPNAKGKDPVEGTLQAVNGSQLVILSLGKPEFVNSADGVTLHENPKGLSATAALVLEADVAVAGAYTIEFQYATDGLSWSAKHSLIYDEDKSQVDSWATYVSVVNDSGVNFNNATVRLISGKVAAGLEDAPGGVYAESARFAAPAMVGSASSTVESVGDQNVFVLPGTITLAGGQSRQIPLFDASTYGRDVPVKKTYVVGTNWARYGYNNVVAGNQQQAGIRLTVENCEKHNLGKPLPAGSVEVQQRKNGKTLQLTGSTRIGEKAQDEIFDLNIATSSEVKWDIKLVGKKQVSGTVAAGDDEDAPAVQIAPVIPGRVGAIQPAANAVFEEREFELTVYNYKRDKEVSVKVEVNGTLKQLPVGWTKLGADRSETNVTVKKSDKTSVKFTTRQQVR
jgi:hypothetical protein